MRQVMATHGELMQVRSATDADIAAVFSLIARAAGQGDILHRDVEDVRRAIREFVVADVGGTIVGCASLAVFEPDLAEVRSVFVDPDRRVAGVGARLVRYTMDIARQLDIGQLFLLTRVPGFFAKLGFRTIDIRIEGDSLPLDLLAASGRSLEGRSVMTCQTVQTIVIETRRMRPTPATTVST